MEIFAEGDIAIAETVEMLKIRSSQVPVGVVFVQAEGHKNGCQVSEMSSVLPQVALGCLMSGIKHTWLSCLLDRLSTGGFVCAVSFDS